jgi:hypothetical protein
MSNTSECVKVVHFCIIQAHDADTRDDHTGTGTKRAA